MQNPSLFASTQKLPAVLILWCFGFLAHADTITLKDGKSYHGRVVSEDAAIVTFETAEGRLSLPKTKVQNIQKKTLGENLQIQFTALLKSDPEKAKQYLIRCRIEHPEESSLLDRCQSALDRVTRPNYKQLIEQCETSLKIQPDAVAKALTEALQNTSLMNKEEIASCKSICSAAYLLLAEQAIDRQKSEEAASHIQKVLALNPANMRALEIFTTAQGYHSDIVAAAYRTAVDTNPTTAVVVAAADIFRRQGRDAEAYQTVNKHLVITDKMPSNLREVYRNVVETLLGNPTKREEASITEKELLAVLQLIRPGAQLERHLLAEYASDPSSFTAAANVVDFYQRREEYITALTHMDRFLATSSTLELQEYRRQLAALANLETETRQVDNKVQTLVDEAWNKIVHDYMQKEHRTAYAGTTRLTSVNVFSGDVDEVEEDHFINYLAPRDRVRGEKLYLQLQKRPSRVRSANLTDYKSRLENYYSGLYNVMVAIGAKSLPQAPTTPTYPGNMGGQPLPGNAPPALDGPIPTPSSAEFQTAF